ncbi:MAG: DUF554 family protein [Limisphaerales bacterium]
MVGTWANVAGIVAGAVLGWGLRRELTSGQQLFLKRVLGALVVYLGFRMVWISVGGSVWRVLGQLGLALIALVIGNLIGKALGLQKQSNKLGKYSRDLYAQAHKRGRPERGDGFVSCAILFCVGPLGLLGALQEGLQNDPRVLLVKAVMDGMAAFALVRLLGMGVALAALPVLATQGTITLGARALRPMLDHPSLWNGVSAVGGLLVASTALIILDVRKVPLADYLPALVVGPILWRLVA